MPEGTLIGRRRPRGWLLPAGTAFVVGGGLGFGLGASRFAASTPFYNLYPADISLPAGVQYPCAVTALPIDLVGIPDEDRNYVNHVYAVVIAVVREKQIVLSLMARREDASQAHADYTKATDDALARLKAEPIPDGLEDFHALVAGSIELHREYFQQAIPRRAAGATMTDLHDIVEGAQASAQLMAAWSAMEARYGEWSPEVKSSIWHHLCALDLY